MRACTRDDVSPAWTDLRYNHAPTGRLFGPFTFEGHRWYCLNGTSRDSYAGTVFGLSVALDFLANADQPELQTSVANDLMAMADYAYKYYGLQPRPHGMVANPLFGGNDLEGPISPLFFPQAPIQRLHLLQTARHAAAVTGNTAATRRYDLLWAHEVAVTIIPGQVMANTVFDATEPHDAYYKYQLELMSFFNVIRLEPAATTRSMLAQRAVRAVGVARRRRQRVLRSDDLRADGRGEPRDEGHHAPPRVAPLLRLPRGRGAPRHHAVRAHRPLRHRRTGAADRADRATAAGVRTEAEGRHAPESAGWWCADRGPIQGGQRVGDSAPRTRCPSVCAASPTSCGRRTRRSSPATTTCRGKGRASTSWCRTGCCATTPRSRRRRSTRYRRGWDRASSSAVVRR